MRYDETTCSVELSVRLLCEMALKSGDLGGYRFDAEALADGAAVHRKLQAEAGGFYHAEVTLRNTTLYRDVHFSVSGRADGIIRRSDGVEVDEIKCVRGVAFYAPPDRLHLAQLKCYAYFVALRDGLRDIRGRLTYYHVETKKTRYIRYHFQTEELCRFYYGLLEAVEKPAKFLIRRHTEILPRLAEARFPYPALREGQEIMIREAYSTIRRGKRLFVEAPTGTGKTVSSLYPAVRAIGSGYADKIFYLTAKASTRSEAYHATAKLFESGAPLRTIVITAKEQVCMCGARVTGLAGQNLCTPEVCPYAKGYYDRVEGAIWELLENGNGYPRQAICAMAKKYSVCPYELSLDLSEYCDSIICDYNYAFDPSVYFRRYFSPDGKGERYVFLVDEAHNLADRARNMYSAVLRRSEFEGLLAVMDGTEGELFGAVEAAHIAVSRLRRLCLADMVKDAEGNEQGFYMSHAPLEEFTKEMETFRKKCEGWLRKNQGHPVAEAASALSAHVGRYLSVNEFFDKGFRCYVEMLGGDLEVKTYCLDPSPTMNALLNRASSAILFSATLTPPEYFCDVLGSAKEAQSVSLPSPFDPANLCVAVADYLSTRMEDREKSFAKYATVIAATVKAKPGNYIAYFPSYSCLEGVQRVFCEKYPHVEVVIQKQGMGIREKEEFLSAFREDTGHLRIGFCVLGGAFAEGVDLPGSRLIGSVIFGVGLPGLSNERNMIQEYFDGSDGAGYDYAYTYPGMNRVLQAVGRVIRREQDRGIAVLVDDRYTEPKYRALYPAHWQGVQYAGNARSLAEIARRFWENKD